LSKTIQFFEEMEKNMQMLFAMQKKKATSLAVAMYYTIGWPHHKGATLNLAHHIQTDDPATVAITSFAMENRSKFVLMIVIIGFI
jgi:hypothetical protein